MKWFNFNCELKKLELSFGPLEALVLGEEGRGRVRTLVPCPVELSEGCQVILTQTNQGKPKIIQGFIGDHSWLMAISSAGCYTRDTRGLIRAMEPKKVTVYTRGHGAFGDAGRTGSWDDILIRVIPDKGTWLKVVPAGGASKRSSVFLWITEGSIKVVKANEVEVAFEALESTEFQVDEARKWKQL